MDSKNRETDDCTDAARIQHLESENQDLLLLIKSWQQAHGSVSESLQAVSAELSEARSNVLKIEALEQEVASTKKELHRFSDLQKVQNQSEMELIRSHAEREAIEQELSESRQTVASLNKVIERMQAEGDAAAKRLRAELDAAAGESIQLRRKVEENARAQNDLSEARRKVAESVEQISALEALLRKAEEENKELKSGIGRLMDRQQKEEEERENYVDRRIISQMIAKHQQLEGQWRRRDEVFLLICDVLQLSEQDRENIGIRSRRETGGDQGSDKRLSEKFIEFLKKETE
ncbi:centrosomal [Cystoisospora suis]|uniref:Centrosomal n=1 Tax=Cystoisospora suis TaxID=483139 RepID=A0A2C6KU67_9APIC|nr:centrosomal [Cystoisospora suis]